MLNLLTGLFNQVLLAGCCLSLVLVFVSLAGALRLLPVALRYLRLALHVGLILTVKGYRLLFKQVAPIAEQFLGVDLFSPYPRVIASVLVSIGVGMVFIAVTQAPVTLWNLGFCVLHGLAVGVMWENLEDPDDLLLGVKTR